MKLSELTVVSPSEITMIHQASLDILENTGVRIASREVLDFLAGKGVPVDMTNHTAVFPRGLVEECLRAVPASFSLYDRNGNKAFTVGGGEPRCASGHNAIYVIDSRSNERRNSTVRDVEEFAIVSDKLRDIDIVGVPVMPQDVTPKASLLYAVKALFENTVKPLFFSTESRAVNAAIIRMMKAVSGKSDISVCPNAVSQLSPTSPLFWEEGAAEALLDTAREGVPLNMLPEPMTGVSAPYSMAGLLTVHNAETLSGIVMAQLARPGTPVLYGSSWTTFDMKNMQAVIGGPETSLLRIAGCQMAKHYRVPCHTTAPNSDSNAHDEQNAWEKAFSNFCSIGSGNDIVMNSGMFATGLTISLEQLVLDDEMNGIVRRMARGMEVNADTVGLGVIRSVGPRGSFMTEDHTLDRLRSGEFRETKASNTMAYGAWLNAGAPDSAKLANQKVRELLRGGSAHPVEPAVAEALGRIIRDFEKELE